MQVPLEGDPKRQAHDSIGGYRYQLWQSVHAWLELNEGEELFIEGAEDIDIIGVGDASAVQVKRTANNITLRTESVIEAVSNYWKLLHENQNRKILYRYVTTSNIGIENGSPFGPGVSGLDLWKACLVNPDKIHLLRNFFIAEKRLPADLLSFLESATDDDVQKRLLIPIKWETGRPNTDAVKNAVMRKLSHHGDKYRIPPSRSMSVADHLLEHVFQIASTRDFKSLIYPDFLVLFEEQTTERIPTAELQAMKNAISQLGMYPGAGPSSGLGSIDIGTYTVLQRGIPNHVPGILTRRELLPHFEHLLQLHGILVLTGSTGMGKTTLAKQIAGTTSQNCLWCSLSGKNSIDLRQALRVVGNKLDDTRDINFLVLDDINLLPSNTNHVEDDLGGILYTARERDIKVVITSNRKVPGRLTRAISLDIESQYSVPYLTLDEIGELAEVHNCSKPELAKAWAAIILAHTSGHPQLVHARVTSLSGANWPQISEDDIAEQPSDVYEERANSRQLLISLSHDEIELLHRLSALVGLFRRDHAIAVGEIEPKLSHPGVIFDGLVGPWVEPANFGYFRISSLLSDMASADWPAEKVRQLRVCAAMHILNCGDLTLREAQHVVLLSICTRDHTTFVRLVNSLLTTAGENWPIVAREFSWILYVMTQPGDVLFPDAAFPNQLLRMFQFRVAAEIQPEEGLRIVELWEQEISSAEESDLTKPSRLMFGISVCIHYQVPIDGVRFIAFLQEIHQLMEEMPEFNVPWMQRGAEASSSELAGLGLTNPISSFFAMSAVRCDKDGFLGEMIDALADVPQAFRTQLLDVLQTHPWLASQMLSTIWVREAEKKSPSWEGCLEFFKKVGYHAAQWNCEALVEATARATAVVFEEYKKDPAAALEALNTAKQSLINSSFVIEDGRATTLFHHGDTKAALDIWVKILPDWPPPPSLLGAGTAMNSCHKAGFAALMLRDWQIASQMYLEGYRRAKLGKQKDYEAGFLADAAYAQWKAGYTLDSIRLFDDSLNILESLPDLKVSVGPFTVNRFVGATIVWCAYTSMGYPVDSNQEGVLGRCSAPYRDEAIMELPLAPFEYSWLNLATLETSGDFGTRVMDRVRVRLENCGYPLVRHAFAKLVVRADFGTGQFDVFPKNLIRFIKELKPSCSRMDEIDYTSLKSSVEEVVVGQGWDLADFADGLTAALIATVAYDGNAVEQVKAWKVNSPPDGVDSCFQEYYATALRMLRTQRADAETSMADNASERQVRLLAALQVCILDESTPLMTLNSQILIANYFCQSLWKEEIGKGFSILVSRQWSKIVNCPAALSMPRITVPEITSACNDPDDGFPKAAKVLLAASNSVNLHIDSGTLTRLSELAIDVSV